MMCTANYIPLERFFYFGLELDMSEICLHLSTWVLPDLYWIL